MIPTTIESHCLGFLGTINWISKQNPHDVSDAETVPDTQSYHQWATGKFRCRPVASGCSFTRFEFCQHYFSRRSRKGHPKLKNVLEAPDRGETTRGDCRRVGKRNGLLRLKAARLLIFCVILRHSRHIKKEGAQWI